MSRLPRLAWTFVRGLTGVIVDLVVGDDPRITVGALTALALAGLGTWAGLPTAVVAIAAAVLIAAAFVAVLLADTRRHRRQP